MAADRIFLGAALVFTLIAFAVTHQERSLRRRELVRPARWRQPVRPRVPLPAAVLAIGVALGLGADLGQPVFVVPSPGEEAHALIGWIALAVLSLVVLAGAGLGLGLLLVWRLGFGVPVPPVRSRGAPPGFPGGGL